MAVAWCSSAAAVGAEVPDLAAVAADRNFGQAGSSRHQEEHRGDWPSAVGKRPHSDSGPLRLKNEYFELSAGFCRSTAYSKLKEWCAAMCDHLSKQLIEAYD